MLKKIHSNKVAMLFATIIGALSPTLSVAQSEAGKWNFEASIYLFLPSIDSATASFPTRAGTYSVTTPPAPGARDITINGEQVLDGLDAAFMGAIDAHNGQWGFFADFVYFDISGEKSAARNGPSPIRGTFDLGFEGTATTMVGQYRVISTPEAKMDLLAGVRMFKMETTLGWNITSNPGAPIPVTGRSTLSETLWDGLIGVRGSFAFGDNNAWSVPYYLDIGTGDSDRTAQALLGIAYSMDWGRLHAGWRWVDYDLESGGRTESVTFAGPMVGAIFKF